ncbi:MAG: DUF1844 domain-containing protein [bacterium]|nr:DUF1844 domain-containing protein [bacterium]
MTEPTMSKHDHVLAGLVFQLQAVAMQQLGKLQDPHSGELARDLAGARHTIDLLEMLKVKCRTDTPAELLRMLDQAVMDLQLNFMDETKKEADAEPQATGEDAATEDVAAEPAADTDSPATDEADGD